MEQNNIPSKEERCKQGLMDRFASVWKRWLDHCGHLEVWDAERIAKEPFEKTLETCEKIVSGERTPATLMDEYFFRVLKSKAIREGISSEDSTAFGAVIPSQILKRKLMKEYENIVDELITLKSGN